MDGRNLGRLAAATLDRLGDYPSLFFGETWHTSGDLHTRADRVSAGLRAAGVPPGSRVVVMMANCPEVFVAYHAIWRAGAVVTPAIFLITAPELRHIVVDSGAVAVIATADLLPKVLAAVDGLAVTVIATGLREAATDLGEVAANPAKAARSAPPATSPTTRPVHPDASPKPADLREAATDLGDAGVRNAGVGNGGVRIIDFAELEAADPAPLVDVAPGELGALLYTGGTTGRSKGVPLSHEALSEGGAAARTVTYVPGVTRSVLALPLAHSYGILVTVGGLHATEPPVTVLQRWFQPAVWLALAQEHRAQTAATVPSMLAMLLAQPLEEFDLSELRYLSSGAAPLPAAVRLEIERRIPGVSVVEGYGCTETAGIISATPPGRPKPATVGVAVPGVEVRIVDLSGAELPIGQVGEIVVRGPNVMRGYWHEAAPSVVDGWFPTGDIGRLDAEGYLSIVDRKKDLIIRGGSNVYPRDVEDVLLAHPAVAAAAVVGRPDERLGEEVVAFVALRAPLSVDDLYAYAKSRLAATKYPREIRIVDSIPLTSVGKVDRKRVRSMVSDG